MQLNTFEALKGTASEVASAVKDYASTKKAGGQHYASMIYGDMQTLVNSAKAQAVAVKGHAGQVINSIADQSIGDMARSARSTAASAANHVVNTPVGTLASEAFMAGAGSRPVLALSDGIESARGYGKTLLGDIDKFYHNADGSYNRTKVGATAAAGLGIAGIAGYNMNN